MVYTSGNMLTNGSYGEERLVGADRLDKPGERAVPRHTIRKSFLCFSIIGTHRIGEEQLLILPYQNLGYQLPLSHPVAGIP